jgi:hypothetical protein
MEVRYRSKCHEYEGGWTPEPESAAWAQSVIEDRRIVPMSEIVSFMGADLPVLDVSSFQRFEAPKEQYDFHWSKSKTCQMVNNPRLRRYIEHRILFDYAMSEKPMSVVCSDCYIDFRNHMSRNR